MFKMIIENNKKTSVKAIFVVFMVFSLNTFSQDIYLSRYEACPQYLNPALTGYFLSRDMKQRINFYSSFKTIQNFKFNNVSFMAYDRKLGRYGIGGNIMNKSYGPGVFNYMNANLSCSYNITEDIIYYKHNLYAGLQIGIINKYFNAADIYFEDQYDISIADFNNVMVSREPIRSESIYSFDGSLGCFYRYNAPTETWNPFAGLKIGHAAFPNLSYLKNKERTPAYVFLHGGTYINIAHKFDDGWIDKSILRLCPKIYYKNNLDELSYIIAGSSFSYKTKQFNSSKDYNEFILGFLYNTYYKTFSVQFGFKKVIQSYQASFFMNYGMNTNQNNVFRIPVNTTEIGIILKN